MYKILLQESASLAERLIKGQVVNAQNAECIYVLKNENQKLKDKVSEMASQTEHSKELRRQQSDQRSNKLDENELLHEKVSMLLEVSFLDFYF